MRTQKSAIMNKFKFYFIVLITTFFLFSCSKDDTTTEITPIRDYKLQFDADNATIETYLDTHYLDMDLADENFADKDVTIAKITDADTQLSIMSYLNSATFPKLLTRPVNLHGIEYTIYYLVLREGEKNTATLKGGESPTNTDAVLASYSGRYLQSTIIDGITTVAASPDPFDEVKFPNQFFSLLGTIKGWGEIFPQFTPKRPQTSRTIYTFFSIYLMICPAISTPVAISIPSRPGEEFTSIISGPLSLRSMSTPAIPSFIALAALIAAISSSRVSSTTFAVPPL